MLYSISRTDPHNVILYWRGIPIAENISDRFTANITQRLLGQLIDGYNRDVERQREETSNSYHELE